MNDNNNPMMNFGTERLPFETQEQDKPGEYAAAWDGAMDDVPSFEEQAQLDAVSQESANATELSASAQDDYNGGLKAEMAKAAKRENMFNRYDIADKVNAMKQVLISVRPALISLKTITRGALVLETAVINLDSYFQDMENMTERYFDIIEQGSEADLENFINVYENRLDGLIHQSRFMVDKIRHNAGDLNNEELQSQTEAACNDCDATIDRVYTLLRASKDVAKNNSGEATDAYSAAPALSAEPEVPVSPSIEASEPSVDSSSDFSSSEISMNS